MDEPVADQVRSYIEQRKELGVRRYGTPLHAHNGRDWLRDAFEEAVDMTLYLAQGLIERDGRLPAGAALEDDIDRALDMPGPVAETGADLNRMSRPAPKTFVSKTGKVLTEADLDALADAAECAHDANMLAPTCPCPCHWAAPENET